MISGHGLHGGVYCEVRLHRDAGPVRFSRGGVLIPARAEQVVATQRSTTLGEGAARVGLVEHLLAALHVRGWWRDLVIEASADELPILDGSSLPWLELIDPLGPPPEAPDPLVLERVTESCEGDSVLRAEPGAPALATEIAFDHPAIGQQRWQGGPEDYPVLLGARTFGFLRDLSALREAGLAAHASAENVIVFGDTGPLTPLRSSDEPVRHKALDVLGDLFLLGRPLKGRLAVSRGSHRSHVAFVKRLLERSPPPTP